MESVLIIDDEEAILELLARYLKLAGFPVETAMTGEAALNLYRAKLHNIVLCDIRLPDVDGKDLIVRLKEYNPLVNIVMITGFTSMDNVVHCLGQGATDYFTKPFRSMQELVDEVKHLNAKIDRWK